MSSSIAGAEPQQKQSNKSGPSGDFYAMARYQSISDLISNFTWIFHKAMSETNPSNIVYSPIAVSSAIFSILLGADGVTRDEVSEIFVTGGNDDHFAEEFSRVLRLLKKLEAKDDNNNDADDGEDSSSIITQFDICQRLFHSSGDSLVDEYTKLLNSDLGIDTQSVDFTANSNTFRKISLWLEHCSAKVGNPAELKAALRLDALNRLMFVSKMRFSGSLDLDLRMRDQEAFFYTSNNNRVSTKMMGVETEMVYAVFPQLDARAVSIPYKGNRCSLTIFLPKGKNGINQLEHCLRNYKTLSQLINAFQTKRKIRLQMPEVNIKKIFNMNDAIKQLGASSVFDINYADFGRLEEMPENIFVSGLVQCVHFDLHTQSLEMASKEFNPKAKADPESLDFIVEHPFFFMVYDQVAKNILVAGRISNPVEM